MFSDFEKYSDRIALIEENGVSITYGELIRAADTVANCCETRRLVFFVCKNTYGAISGYVGFLRAGVVPVMLSSAIKPEQLFELLHKYRPDYAYFPEDTNLFDSGGQPFFRANGYVMTKMKEQSLNDSAPLNNKLALLLTTSGSTGSPKHVRQSYGNIESNTAAIIEYLGINNRDRAITTLPMHYTYGLSIINTHLSAGASVILTEKALIDRVFWRQCKEYGATTFGGVPYTFEILKKLRFEKMGLPALRYITQAGGKLTSDLVTEFAEACVKKGIELIVMYGQTEATARMSWLPFTQSVKKPASIGIPIPGGRFRIVCETGKELCVPGATGELIYEGDNVALGYAESRADLSKGDEWHGRLETGDLAWFDEDGFYYISGRKKRFLKLFGSRINLDETENLLKSVGVDCACGGSDDRLVVYVEDESAKTSVTRYLIERLGLNLAGFSVSVIGKLPRGESGKILYGTLRQSEESGRYI